jgi:hypothetical protein
MSDGVLFRGFDRKMVRKALIDNLWEQLQVTMAQHGCYQE